MAWRPGSRRRGLSPLEFELLPEDREEQVVLVTPAVSDDGELPAVAPSVVTRAARASWSWLRARSPMQLVAGAVVVALGVTTGAAVGVQRGRERDARIAVAPGGVLELSAPVGERWSHELPEQEWSEVFGPWGDVIAVLDGDTVVIGQPQGTMDEDLRADGSGSPSFHLHGWDLHGIDLDTGEARWTHHLPGGMECSQRISASSWQREGPAVLGPQEPALTCLHGEDGDFTVTVLAADGTRTQRPLPDIDEHAALAMGPGGTLWIADRAEGDGTPIRPAADDVVAHHVAAAGTGLTGDDDSPTGLVVGGADELLLVNDLRLRVEDAHTGEHLWEQVLPPEPETGSCTTWGPDDVPQRAPHAVSLWWGNDPEAMIVHGCGVATSMTTTGQILTEGGDDLWRSETRPLADGGVLRVRHDGRGVPQSQEIVDHHGVTLTALEGEHLLDPWTTDGLGGLDLRVPAAQRDTAGRFFWRQGNSVVVARDARGTELWQTRREDLVRSIVARAGDIVVLHTTGPTQRGSHLVALDQRTGDLRWEQPLEAMHVLHETAAVVSGAWTDGEVLVITTPGHQWSAEGPLTWTAHDLRTGRVLWQQVTDTVGEWISGGCMAVAGRLLCLDGLHLVRLA